MAAKKTTNKSEFIRSQPATAPAADVIAKGKAEGLKISPSLVYMVRGRVRTTSAKKSAAKKAPTASKPSPPAPKSAKNVLSKADFVRARAHLSPKEIVEDAKAAGIRFEAQYVYNVRRHDVSVGKSVGKTVIKQRGHAMPRPAPRPPAAPTIRHASSSPSRAEDLLKAVAAELGLARAIEILAAERARVRAVIGS